MKRRCKNCFWRYCCDAPKPCVHFYPKNCADDKIRDDSDDYAAEWWIYVNEDEDIDTGQIRKASEMGASR